MYICPYCELESEMPLKGHNCIYSPGKQYEKDRKPAPDDYDPNSDNADLRDLNNRR